MVKLKEKKYFWFLLLFLSSLSLFFLSSNSTRIQKSLSKTIVHSKINFQSNSIDPKLSAVKEFLDQRKIQPKEISISFKMKPYDLYYGNVFQTDSYGKGMRMELYAPPGQNEASLDIFIGWLPNLNIEKRFNLLKNVKINESYSVKVNLNKDKELKVFINGKCVLREPKVNIKYTVSDIVIGAGYNKERGFKGEIDNFDVEYNIIQPSYILLIVRFILFILLLFSLYKLILGNYHGLVRVLAKLRIFIINRKIQTTALFTALSSVGLYNVLFFNKYFPLSEGWFSVYANYILKGAMPYRDFNFMLPPLYPMQLAAFINFFGNEFIFLRFLGIFIILAIATVSFVLYLRFLPPFAASLVTVVSIMFYQSGTAHINYDFLHFLTLYSLLSLYFMLRYWDIVNNTTKKAYERKAVIYIILSGLFACLALLIKQSNGLMVNIFLFFGLLIVAFKYNRSQLTRTVIFYSIGLFSPLVLLFAWLAANGSVWLFMQQVIFDSLYVKGTLAPVLFAWFPRLMTNHNIIALIIAFLISIIAFSVILIRKRLRFRDKEEGVLRQDNHFIVLCLLLVLLALCILIPYLDIGLSKSILSSVFLIELYYALIVLVAGVSFTICGIYLAKILFKLPSNNYDVFLLSMLSLGLLYGTGTSGGFASAGAFLGLGLIFKYLFYFPRPLRYLGRVLFFAYSFALILFMASQKYISPYNWWGLAAADIRKSINPVNIRLLNGFYLPEDTIRVISEIKDSVEENAANPNEQIYTFPNIPFFYLLTDRFPCTFGIVHWFDFISDKVAADDARRLIFSPPKIIIMLDMPSYVWRDHEQLFRGGKPSKQRLILETLNKLTSVPGAYVLKSRYMIPDGYVLTVWVRADNSRFVNVNLNVQ